MTDNYFDKFAKQQTERKKSATETGDSVIRGLVDCSDDSSGNELSEFFDSADLTACKDFLKTMKRRHYPGAHDLYLRRLKSRRVLTEHELVLGSWSASFSKKLRNKYLWTTLWNGQGYRIGLIKNKKISMHTPSNGISSVYLCTDGRLRCSRSKPVFGKETSRAYGYGTIPKSELMGELKFSVGEFIGGSSSEVRIFKEMPVTIMLENHILPLV